MADHVGDENTRDKDDDASDDESYAGYVKTEKCIGMHLWGQKREKGIAPANN